MSTAERVRVVVGVGGNAGGVAMLRAAVAYARTMDAEVVAVRAWLPPGGEFNCHLSPGSPLLQACRERAGDVLVRAFTDAFGGRPAGLDLSFVIGRGEVGPVLIGAAGHPDDVLVVGGARRRSLSVWCRGSISGYCLDHAVGKVLVLDNRNTSAGRPQSGTTLPTVHGRRIAV